MKYTESVTLDVSRAGRDLDFACVRACPSLDEYAPSYSEEHWNRRYWYGSVPRYSTDPNDASLLEAEIERRGQEDDYIRALLALVTPDGSSVLAFWNIRRATPEQCARAFLQVME